MFQRLHLLPYHMGEDEPHEFWETHESSQENKSLVLREVPSLVATLSCETS